MIDHAGIAALIPHAGRMVLLDAVTQWDSTHIACRSRSHRDTDNPLAARGRLDVLCGIEYAGQAMALHGALLAVSGAPPAQGFLASVRDVDCGADRLDDLETLEVTAEMLHGEAGRVIYGFALRSGDRVVLSGRAAVVLDV